MKPASPTPKANHRTQPVEETVEVILQKAYRIHRWDPLSRAAFHASTTKRGRARTRAKAGR